MAKIESVHDLPEWFDIEKYKCCESFRAVEWYEQLYLRQRLLVIFSGPIDSYKQGARPVAVKYAEAIRDWPVFRFDSEPNYIGRENMPIAEITTKDLMEQAYSDKYWGTKGDCGEPLFDRWSWIAETGDRDKPISDDLSLEPLRITHSYPHNTNKPCIMVELSASDAVLIKAFSDWLKEAKASRHIESKKRRKPIYTNWARYGLLAFLDLQVWELQTGNQIIDRVMSSALMRNGYDIGESNVRKTVARWADDMMQDLAPLQALAASEDASQIEAGNF